jgi:hypothetical protein
MKLGAALATSPIVRGLAVIWRSARQRPVISTLQPAMQCAAQPQLHSKRTAPNATRETERLCHRPETAEEALINEHRLCHERRNPTPA